jgi:tRNA pseudouridine55 synthase
MIFNLYKKRGETPLECIRRFAENNPEFKEKKFLDKVEDKMTYLGRLDPLAEGVLLMASGEDVKKKEEFLGLDKDYDFTALFGFETDTYDILGKVEKTEKLSELSEGEIMKVAAVYEGEREQKYPLYSSKIQGWKEKTKRTVPALGHKDKALGTVVSSFLSSPEQEKSEGIFQQKDTPVALENNSSQPSKKITIHKLQFHGLDTLNSKELFGRLLMDISRVNGDFRQEEILTLWRKIIFEPSNDQGKTQFFLGCFSAHVSSGTYIRSLVNDMGKTLSCGATTLSIKRMRVGDYKVEDSLK